MLELRRNARISDISTNAIDAGTLKRPLIESYALREDTLVVSRGGILGPSCELPRSKGEVKRRRQVERAKALFKT
jgi:hypothetical protein